MPQMMTQKWPRWCPRHAPGCYKAVTGYTLLISWICMRRGISNKAGRLVVLEVLQWFYGIYTINIIYHRIYRSGFSNKSGRLAPPAADKWLVQVERNGARMVNRRRNALLTPHPHAGGISFLIFFFKNILFQNSFSTFFSFKILFFKYFFFKILFSILFRFQIVFSLIFL